MRNLKTTFFQTTGRPVDSYRQEPAEQQATTITTSVKDTSLKIRCSEDYSPIWRQAFALAHNVRFTRTPDVELMRKRSTTGLSDAKTLSLPEKKIQIEHDTPTLESHLQTESGQKREAIPVSTAEVIHSRHEEEATEVTEAIAELDNHVVGFISDWAFFEFSPFALEDVMDDTPQQAEDDSLVQFYRVVECLIPRSVQTDTLSKGIQDQDIVTAAQVNEVLASAVEQPEADDRMLDPAAENNITQSSVIEPEPEIFREVVENASVTAFPLIKSVVSPLLHEMEYRSTSAPLKPFVNRSYLFPPISLLQQPVYKNDAIISQETLERSAGLLESVLEDFGIRGEIIHVHPGPAVTLYEFKPAPGMKSSRVIGLSDDIARSMSAVSARVAVISGRNVIGIELPNTVREIVYLREIVQSKAFETVGYKLPLALGKNIGGEPVIAELAKMPHLLVAGTTGSGKSVAINTMILSLLYHMPPEKCRLIMVDPKMLELSMYDGIPHLLTPVVTDPKKAVTALKWAVREMENRYRKMAKLGVRNIDGFNGRISEALAKNETITCIVQDDFDKKTGEVLYSEEVIDLTLLPYIVIIVDEMADLMMVAGKEIEGAIQRLAQMARAAGIHLIMATQRPSVDVITGTIKANFPTRISFQVTSKIDSRTILGEQGAETLLGQGDMLYMIGGGRLVRVHGPFVSDREVEHVVAHLKTQGVPEYLATVTDSDEDAANIAEVVTGINGNNDSEELYMQAVKIVMRDKKCSTSYIQRRLNIGYNKAASLVERMEEEGLVGAANHVGKREILMHGYKHDDVMDN
ncbi:MAG: S-DNA-T family [Candidatus Tokpelaia sp. JSC189]|nr:MAG: S-DNA-T family [Candidatus Tokpelaia sp. JSC189]